MPLQEIFNIPNSSSPILHILPGEDQHVGVLQVQLVKDPMFITREVLSAGCAERHVPGTNRYSQILGHLIVLQRRAYHAQLGKQLHCIH